jgi:sarcosine oxidase subunit alpha
MKQSYRAASGGRIDRSRRIVFRFNGRDYTGHPGDTLASALIANGVRLIARSFKYHRPRGIFATGADEPNALIRIGTGAAAEPNIRATQVLLHEGLVAQSQNCWPSVNWDIGALIGLAAPMFSAGFYYKTFMWPGFAWPFYESIIRRAAGLGVAPLEADPDRYEHRHAEADIVIVGGGVSGLASALTAANSGLKVMLVDDGDCWGGQTLDESQHVDGVPLRRWVDQSVDRLAALPHVTLLPHSTVYARYDHGEIAILQQVPTGSARYRQCRWRVHSRQLILATGASERHIAFVNNDLPGIMLASAAALYATRYAALPGRRAIIFANNDSGYEAARLLEQAGVDVACIVDCRIDVSPAAADGLRCRNIRRGYVVTRALGRRAVTGCEITSLVSAAAERLDCDLLLTAGGWTPRVQLSTHLGERPVFDPLRSVFLPVVAADLRAAGACAGLFDLATCLQSGFEAGKQAAALLGVAIASSPPIGPASQALQTGHPMLVSPSGGARGPCFVDFQTDVTTADLDLAHRENFRSIEHVKRYTTLGMGTDQGRTGAATGIAHIAAISGQTPGQIGVTTYRTPYTPVTLGALAGRHIGKAAAPTRVTPLHEWHKAAGAIFMLAGQWQRAQLFPYPGEEDQHAVNREARNVREAVGITDVSTLGKFELHGADVPEFLERLYVNGWRNLAVGRSRYGVMLRLDGMVLDDGTTSRLSDDTYFMTTTTGNAERIYAHMQRCLQLEWPELDVVVTPVTEQWGAFAIAGPRARALLDALRPDFSTGNAEFPYMSVREGKLSGIPVRAFRISFAGELGYEIYAPAGMLAALWTKALEVGAALGVMPYGTEAMMVLRIEKGFFVPGFEADGRTTLEDLGLGRMLSSKKACIGQAALRRKALSATGRLQMVGVVAVDPMQPLPRGAQLVAEGSKECQGHITSMAYSPVLGHWIGLGLLRAGRSRHGQVLTAMAPALGEQTEIRIVDPVFFDPEGKHSHA